MCHSPPEQVRLIRASAPQRVQVIATAMNLTMLELLLHTHIHSVNNTAAEGTIERVSDTDACTSSCRCVQA